MTTLIVDIEKKEDLDILIPLMDRLNISWHSNDINTDIVLTKYTAATPTDYDAFMQRLNRLSANGDASSFGDASEYQREARKDRNLDFRNDQP